MLRHADGLHALRAIRDDNSTSPAIRWKVVNQLQYYDTTDRIAGARTLDSIARDTTCRPTLRWRAATDLTSFGDRGREMGAAALRALSLDETLPVPVRIDATRALGVARPDLRAEIVRLLHRLSAATENPRARLRACRAIGRFDPTEAALTLSEMAEDSTLAAGIRLRAAVAMAGLHREYRDRSAVTAKDIAYDDGVPWHIRLKAARWLARWSEPCRTEALELLEKWRTCTR